MDAIRESRSHAEPSCAASSRESPARSAWPAVISACDSRLLTGSEPYSLQVTNRAVPSGCQ